jgi:hypothetical protein
MTGRYAVAALVLMLIDSPAAAQTGPSPTASDPGQGWTGQQIGPAEYWRNNRREEWRKLPVGPKQELWIDPAGQS